ncbi:hypothetical protein [Embleya sp. NPDC005971]|uniref:hypothetical protein n=1 Tax=Embleya sp. NPDC005971 TaxID=3156724 RepID=UPI0033D907E4
MLYTAGEIIYTGSATALVVATTPAHRLGRALARFQLGHGIGVAASPAVLMGLLAWGPGVLWASLTAATVTAAVAIHRWGPDERAPDERTPDDRVPDDRAPVASSSTGGGNSAAPVSG